MKTELIRKFVANILAWSLEVVDQDKDNAGSHYLKLTVLNTDINPDVADPNDKQVICVFKDFSKEQIDNFKALKAENKPLSVSAITLEEHSVDSEFHFCHLHQETRLVKKTGITYTKGDKVKLPNGEIKWTTTMKVTIVNDNALNIHESPESVALGIIKNTELCAIKPVTTQVAVEADAV